MQSRWATAVLAVLLPAISFPSAAHSVHASALPILVTALHPAPLGLSRPDPTVDASKGGTSAPSAPALYPSVVIHDLRVPEPAEFRLYSPDGSVDPKEVSRVRELLGEGTEVPMRVRTLQLLVKASAHFGGAKVIVVSSYRKGRRHGPHSTGAAIDFQLVGVPASRLASYLRKEPRVGVGLYTHPKTQFVHLDDREVSYHWLDASPPGAHWRERAMKDPMREARDATYSPEMDLPEQK